MTDFTQGHPAANCSVSASRLQPSPSSIVIDRLYIEGGAQIVGGITLRPNQKEQPIKLHRERDYPELLETIAAHPVAFYDVTDRRAWLIDGASALLYLVRISLHLDAKNTESTYDWVFDASKFEYNRAGSNGRIAAIKTLKSWSNRDLQLYVKKQTTNNNGDVIQEFSTLGDRIDKILHWLELLMDRDVYLALRDGITVSQTLDRRRSISGYDLLDVIKPPGPITTRATHLLSSGDGWFDLFPTIRATTILGRDFGNLILPDEPNQICANWRSIPTGLDYMTVSMSTLKMVYDKRIQTSATTLNKGEITKNILWASPCPPFRPCYCIQGTNGGKQKHLDPVQFLISRKSWIPTPKPKDETLVDIDTLESTGAVVFANLPLFGRKPTSTAEDAGDPSSSASGVHTQKKRWKSFRGLLGMKKSEGDS